MIALFALSTSSCAQKLEEAPKVVPAIGATASKPDILGAAAALEDLFNRRYTDKHGVHLESVLSALGATAGFGTQMAIREAYIKTGQTCEQKAFVVVETKDGQKYYYGEALNKLLFEGPPGSNTPWDLVSAGAESVGAQRLPDIAEIVTYNAKTLGTPAFGLPRDPEGHEPHEIPVVALQATWPKVHSILDEHHIQPKMLGWIPAIAAQKVIIQQSKKIAPALSVKIVMESMLPMSKMNPETIIQH